MSDRPVRVDEVPSPGGAVGSIYVHAPFCARRCLYCDFAVQVRRTGDLPGWLEALAGELRLVEREGRFPLADTLDTLYVGGGTPSLLGPGAMAGLADLLGRPRLEGGGGSGTLEWTAEANPESLTDEVAGAWRAAGVTRLSLGVQSFHEGTLRWMGRLHGPRGAEEAVRRTRASGFESLSVDLIFGVPARLGRSLEADLDRVLALEVPHVSLYGLTAEDGTPLGRAVAAGREELADEERYRDAYLTAVERLRREGYEAYEVSNLARPGHASRHNRVYWSGAPYLGLGNGAHSYRHPIRRWNLRDWGAYHHAAVGGRAPWADQEILTPDATRLERIWLGLRTSRGVSTAGLGPEVHERVRRWDAAGWARVAGDVVRLTPEGWLLMDRLVVELDQALDACPGGGAGDRLTPPPAGVDLRRIASGSRGRE